MTTKEFATTTLHIVARRRECLPAEVDATADLLDEHRGVLLTSRYEYPGRYTRWDIGTLDPPLVIEAVGNKLAIEALNDRGLILKDAFASVIASSGFVTNIVDDDKILTCDVEKIDTAFLEEDRSKMPHIMNVVRLLRDAIACDDPHFGFYGVFGYDLGIDFMGVTRIHERKGERDLVLYCADRVYVTDHENQNSYCVEYEFTSPDGASSEGIERTGSTQAYVSQQSESSRDMKPGEYAQIVGVAHEYFARGDLFETVPSQTFSEPCEATPAQVFHQLLDINPAPYGALINLGHQEWTVSASPEMFVRVERRRVESCPIAGTIARGSGNVSDEQQIETLLNSKKEESELTMCTDVDRNDKSRVCVPETINVIGRRQIEMYSRLIHTVDHVEGQLYDGYDAIDAFLTHMWAVTVTGAPKMWAMNFIEKFEKSPRRFYGGSMGFVGANGSMNTGLMLRTVHFHHGGAHVRVGATLLADSDAEAEERETELKASAMLEVIRYCHAAALGLDVKKPLHAKEISYHDGTEIDTSIESKHIVNDSAKTSPRVLLIDCEDSFVHTLAGYFRMCGAVVHTRRVGFTDEEFAKDLEELSPDLIVLSPGPGSPTDFGLSCVIELCRKAQLPIFGVCLGLQALIEYFGGELGQLEVPMHGKPSSINLVDDGGKLFKNMASTFVAGRYHSLYAREESLPGELIVTAKSDDGVIMAIEHRTDPIAAVQFHPESIMTFEDNAGQTIVRNVLDQLARH